MLYTYYLCWGDGASCERDLMPSIGQDIHQHHHPVTLLLICFEAAHACVDYFLAA